MREIKYAIFHFMAWTIGCSVSIGVFNFLINEGQWLWDAILHDQIIADGEMKARLRNMSYHGAFSVGYLIGFFVFVWSVGFRIAEGKWPSED